MAPAILSQVLRQLPKIVDENLLVGLETSDDAAVYRLSDELAVIQTVDFFTPVVDDPYIFGQVAAANALSDIYAMGGRPLLALNIACFPGCLSPDVLREILTGGADKVKEAGAIIAGGHTVQDDEPKYGLAVTGLVHPDEIISNAGARPGDALVLTKPLGTGIIATAVKAELAPPESRTAAVTTMCALNREAAAVMRAAGATACTDITGFGLLGHAAEMAEAGGVSFTMYQHAIPLLPGALELAAMGMIPGGAYSNREHLSERVSFAGSIAAAGRMLLYDPQTSGGLLIALPPEQGMRLVKQLAEKGLAAALIGTVTGRQPWLIRVEE
ncbi:selenide, water dikinase SelD [Desulfotomaculum copahuensis]|uniref:Selenide, water dikinase n=1 Tax=Desulfotomaculum copahuensis TaxID=1838280 RepID=A0A1B7LHX5_9FIRM|nr:selenide, water dikinase SelD [Desulfotomaculum copahuensis]